MKFIIRPYRPGDLATLVPMIEQSLNLHDLRPEHFARDFLMAPGFRAEHLLVAAGPTQVVASDPPAPVYGFLLAPRRDPLAPADRGFIAAFGVDRRNQRLGVGRALLQRAIDDMRAEGVSHIDVADVPVRYFLPGIDQAAFPVAHDLLTHEFAFAVRDEVASMGLDGHEAPRPPLSRLSAPLSRVGPESVHLLHNFLAEEFDPSWWAFFERSLAAQFTGEHLPMEVIGYWADGRLLGVVHFRDGRFGPLAVAKAARGRGIGTMLTFAAVDRLRSIGYRNIYFMIATAEMEPFYARLGFSVLRRFSRLRLET